MDKRIIKTKKVKHLTLHKSKNRWYVTKTEDDLTKMLDRKNDK